MSTPIVSSISGLEIYAPSAGFAPTNSADVSAIASGYAGIGSADASAIASAYAQSAVSSVSGEYYGTGNVSGFATTAYVDSAVSGVEISFDSSITTASSTAGVTAGVNTAILSAYAYESSNSAKLDATAQVVSATASAYDMDSYAWATEINGLEISAAKAYSASYATTAETAYSADFASSSDEAIYDTNGRFLSSFVDSSYVDSAVSSKADSSALSSYALSSDVSSTIDTVSNNSASWGAGVSLPITGSAGTDSATYGETSVEFNRYDTAGEPDIRTATLSPDALDITYTVDENSYYSVHVTENGVEFGDPDGYYTVTPYDINNWNSAVETVSNNSASWGQSGVDSATVSSIASSYAKSAVSAASGDYYPMTGNPSSFATTNYVDSAVSGVEISFDSSIATASSTAGITASVNTAILSAYAYESSNSAKLDATAFSTVSANFLTSQTVTALGDDGTYITSINGSALSGQGGGGGASLPITGSVGAETATYDVTSVSFVRNDTAGEPDIRTATLSPDQFQISYTYNNEDYTSMTLSEHTLDFSDSEGSHVVDAYSIDSWNSAVDTVANNSANWGGGGLVTATASAKTIAYTSTSTYYSSFTGISSVNGSALLVSNLLPNAQQADGNSHFHFMPKTSPWGSTEYPGVLSPLQYATGACLAMKQQNNYGAYYKGNEWFISDIGMNTAANGVVRAELHRTRGIHLYGSSLNSATGFHLNGSGVNGQSGTSAWQYGPTEYNMLTAVNDTVSSNSAAWGGGGGAGVVTATGSGLAGTPIPVPVISSINGSSLYAVGSYEVSNGSSRWNKTTSAVSANSANWNSAYSLISGVTALMDAI